MPKPLAQFFADFEPSLQSAIRTGSSEAARNADRLSELVETGMLLEEGDYDSALERLQGMGFNAEIAGLIIAALTFVTGFFTTDRTETGDEFVAAAVKAGVIDDDPDSKKIISELFAAFAARRQEIENKKTDSDIADELLPALERSSYVIDLRVRFLEEKEVRAVPVALVRLHTDTHDEIYFQMSRPKLKRLIMMLGMALKDLEKAEEWSDRIGGKL